jgi:very-short-patch-repair endonuclease
MASYHIILAKESRKALTPAEARLWFYLRSRKLEFRKFVRQKVLGRYRADFYCHEELLVIELDGASHDNGEAQTYDLERTRWLEAQSIRVLRFQNHEVLKNTRAVLECIKQNLTARPDPQTPALSLLPAGEGGSEADG